MPVISFANAKGGAGKTTAALLLACELARKGHRVTLIDADPQHWISRWHDISGDVPNISVISHVTMASIEHHIRENRDCTDCFLIDLPGTRSPLLATALGLSDHVLIPVQGCAMDARGGGIAVEDASFVRIKNEQGKTGVDIAHRFRRFAS